MNLQEAIEITEDLLLEGPYFPPNDRRDAVMLIIEAAKFIIFCRSRKFIPLAHLLPGETPEEE